jgi:putative ABC transport system ATP-binding protein
MGIPHTEVPELPIIETRNVNKTYVSGELKVEALKNVSITVDEGEMVAVMGPSGCGKTTLLNCISGIDDVTSGQVFVEGKEITNMDDDSKTIFRAKRMGFVFQFFNLLPVLTAEENVELPLLLSNERINGTKKRAVDMLAAVGLQERAKMRPASLSGGERQRVTIARALINNPAIIWADEPTGNLDKKTADEVVGLMRKLNKENGETFMIVTHDPEVGAVCDRIIHMRDGLIVDDNGSIHQIAKEIRSMG